MDMVRDMCVTLTTEVMLSTKPTAELRIDAACPKPPTPSENRMPLITIPKDIRARLARMTPTEIQDLRGRHQASSVPAHVTDTSQTAGPANTPSKRRRHID